MLRPNLTQKVFCSDLFLSLLTVKLPVLNYFDSNGCSAPNSDTFDDFAKGSLSQDGLHLESRGLGCEETSRDQAIALRRCIGLHPFICREQQAAEYTRNRYDAEIDSYSRIQINKNK